jgi:regulator of chromosome condensation
MARAAGSRAASAKPVATKEVKGVKVNGTGRSHPLSDSKLPLTRRGSARAAKKTELAPVANGVDEESEPESEAESEPEPAAKRKLNASRKSQLVLTNPQLLRA